MRLSCSESLRMCVMGASGSVGLGICKEALSVQGLTTYAVSRRRPECLRAMEGDKLIWLDHDIFMLNPRCHSFDFVLNLAFSGCHTKDTPGAFLGNLEQNLGIVKNLLLVSKEASTGLCIHLGSELEALFADPKFLPTSVIESAGNDRARRLYALQKHMQSTVVSEFYALEPSIFSVVLHAPYIVSAFNAPNSLAGMIEYSILKKYLLRTEAPRARATVHDSPVFARPSHSPSENALRKLSSFFGRAARSDASCRPCDFCLGCRVCSATCLCFSK